METDLAEWSELKPSTYQRKPTKVILFVPQNPGKTQELEAPHTSQDEAENKMG